MTGRPSGQLAQPTQFIIDVAGENRTTSTLVSSSGTSSERFSDDLQVQLESLQKLVCELLFRNQQLRHALVEATNESVNIVAHVE